MGKASIRTATAERSHLPKLILKKAALAFITKKHDLLHCIFKPVSQLSFASSKSTLETLEKVVKYVQS